MWNMPIAVIFVAQFCASAQTGNDRDRAVPEVADPIQRAPAQPTPTPFSQSERLHDYLRSFVNPVSLASTAAGAGIGQWRDKPKEWNQGGDAYGRRVASAYAQQVVKSTLLFAGSSLFHEDNRYVPSGRTGFGNRLQYALESTVMARHDDRGGGSHRRLSVSRIMAVAGAALIARSWQPASSRSMRSAAASAGATFGVSAGFAAAREFLPIP